ncbi:AMP-binding protein [Chloroflexi bacterium TSY]|nr:AMP-binding protein [Chloroflexi bacterium TSY]
MTNDTPELISIASRIYTWAARHPERSALVFAPEAGPHKTFSWHTLDTVTNRFARFLAEKGVDDQGRVAIGLRNCPEHILVSVASWKLGATVIPIRNDTPPYERDQILALAEPTVVVTDWTDIAHPTLTIDDLALADRFSADPLPDKIAHPGKAMASGGSTGRPKLIFDTTPLAWAEDLPTFSLLKMDPGMVQLVSGALYHAAPFAWMYMGLGRGQTLILTARFEPAQVADLIEQYQINYAYMAPIMMNRLARLPGIEQRNLSSLDCLIHMAAPCPAWLKRTWIDLIGPEHLFEVYASTEAGIVTGIWGDEWLAHPNSVGKAMPNYEFKIFDAEGQEQPPNEVGEIFIRRLDQEMSFHYVGSPPARKVNGFSTIGDLGWIDEEGYLYIADRRVDMIITGGANVFPAEVEAALTEHPEISDVAVIGLPDDEWGKRVHAVLQARNTTSPPSVSNLDAYCRERLMAYKVPKTYDFVEQLPRNAAGKIRRSALVAEREEKV